MPILYFPDHDSLRLALASGVVPPTVARAPALAGFDVQGRLWLEPEAPVHRDAVSALARFGVRVLGSSAATHSEPVSCWHQLLPLQPAPPAAPRGTVLFELPAEQLAAFTAEVRRVAGRASAYRWLDEPGRPPRVLVRVEDPPYFTLGRALDTTDLAAPRAFVEQAPGVWLPLGWLHPLADQIRPPTGQTILIRPPFDWAFLDDQPFHTELAVLPLVGCTPQFCNVDAAIDVKVRLRWTTAHIEEAAELWVIERDPVPLLESLVAQLDERILGRLSFAVTHRPAPAVVLRVRPGKGPPPVLTLDAPAYAPYLKLPNLFLPVRARLRPALRRDAVRELFAADPKTVAWLRPLADQNFRIESIPDDAFRPLSGCYEFSVAEPSHARKGWRRREAFALDPFIESTPFIVSNEAKPDAEVPASADDEARRGVLDRLRGAIGGLWAKSPPSPKTPAAVPKVKRERPVVDVDRALKEVLRRPEDKQVPADDRPAESQLVRQAIESRILADLGSIESHTRIGDWRELAMLYQRANNATDAALCWLNAIWEQESPSPHDARGWLLAESKAMRGPELDASRRDFDDIPLSQWLTQPASPPTARCVAAFALWASLQVPPPAWLAECLGELRGYLDRHEEWLPVRAAWLAQTAVARLADGDILGLARSRDRLVGRMQESGLGLDLDVPSFLRFAAHGVSERFQKVRDWLKQRREPVRRWIDEQATGRPSPRGPTETGRPTQRFSEFGLEPEGTYTPAYADLILAWGLSRLGEHHAGRDLAAQASRVLANGDPGHGVLLDAFRHRIRQVQEGRPSRGPLPPELLRRVAALPFRTRYVVDKLREHSRILEPSERADAFRVPSLFAGTSRDVGAALVGMADAVDARELNDRALRLLVGAKGTSASAGVVLGLLNVSSRLSEAVLVEVLREAVVAGDGPLEARARLLGQAVFVAVQLGQATLVRELLARFVTLLEGRRGPEVFKGVEVLTGESFRGLRRLGLRADCEKLLHRMETWVLGGHNLRELRDRRPKEWPAALRTLLHIAAGWFFCGHEDRAKAALDEARDQLLYGGELPPAEQTSLALTYAATLGHADPRIALGRLAELFQRLRGVILCTTTNSHYMLKPLELVEAVVRAVVNENFTLGPAVRRWLDDDEFLIRRRIDRDVRLMLEGQAPGLSESSGR